MLANGLEWYDFALYACMTTTISRLFFPDTDQNASILAAFGVFACGFLARPFGGVLFGWIGDKLGRRTALVLSIFMMAVPTGAIGLLPSYAQIGVAAPVLLIILRLLQGLSLGGAFCGAITFLVEHSPPERPRPRRQLYHREPCHRVFARLGDRDGYPVRHQCRGVR